jgi:hypothetical protein
MPAEATQLRGRLVEARSISIEGDPLLDSTFSLLCGSEVGCELEWLAGREPELHLEAPGTSAFLRLARLRPLVLVGHFEDAGASVKVLHVGTTARGLIEVGPNQYLRGLFKERDEVVDKDGRGVLARKSAWDTSFMHYDAADSDFACAHLLEVILVQTYCALFKAKHPVRALRTTLAAAPSLGTSLETHWALKKTDLGSFGAGTPGRG